MSDGDRDRTEYSQDPYEDGTVPADADLATSGRDGATDEDDAASATNADGAADEEDQGDATGTTGNGQRNPDALIEGNRVATAEDME